jgi:hypothetical protein
LVFGFGTQQLGPTERRMGRFVGPTFFLAQPAGLENRYRLPELLSLDCRVLPVVMALFPNDNKVNLTKNPI